jgi:hypothetical protein
MICNYGFRIVGRKQNRRRLVIADDIFDAYTKRQIDTNHEAYLSAFTFGDDFKNHLIETKSTKGFKGHCHSHYLWFDIDNSDLEISLRDARLLVEYLNEKITLLSSEIQIYFSGKKGFCIGVSTGHWRSEPSINFNRRIKLMAMAIGESAKVKIDPMIYAKVQPLRAPNSRHLSTGLVKRYLTHNQLMTMTNDQIKALSASGVVVDFERSDRQISPLQNRWDETVVDDHHHETNPTTKPTVEVVNVDRVDLNQTTMDFIKDGCEVNRAVRLYSAAANLAELGCDEQLAFALLRRPAEKSGLLTTEINRQIRCGLTKGKNE